MEQIEKEVIEWHKKTFPNATDEAIFVKLEEELWELMEEIENGTNKQIFNEMADVAIVCISLLDRIGTSLSEQIKHKLKINKIRIWGEEKEDGSRDREK